jgi:hypothetical protein
MQRLRGAQPIAWYACRAASSFAICLSVPFPCPISMPFTALINTSCRIAYLRQKPTNTFDRPGTTVGRP